MNTLNFLKGYKTYLIAVLTAVYGIAAHNASLSVLAPYLLSGLGLAALRAGVGKVEAAIASLEAKLPAKVQKVVDPVVKAAEDVVNKEVADVK